MQVVFRADGGADIGAGHIQRCRALAQALVSSGANCLFASTPESQPCCRRMLAANLPGLTSSRTPMRKPSAVASAGRWTGWWWTTTGWTPNSNGPPVPGPSASWSSMMCPGAQHDCDILLDQNQTDEKTWREIVPPMAAVLAGPRYACCAGKFQMPWRHAANPNRAAVLVFGASDPHQ